MKMKSTGLAIAGCALLSLAASVAQAAPVFCVSITAEAQGQLLGSARTSGGCPANKIEALSFSYGVISPRDPATGMATGKRQHKPVRIKKEWSPSSRQIFQALVNNELLKEITMDFFAVDSTGRIVLDHTIRLANAFVTLIEHSSEVRLPTMQPNNEPATEIVEFTFQQIEIIDHRNKTSAIDTTESRA